MDRLQNIEILNGKSTKDEANLPQEQEQISSGIVDLEDEEIKSITLLNEIPNFNEIYKNIAEKLDSIKKAGDLKEEFQSLIKEKIDKINLNYETEPNFIYSTNVLESQLGIYDFFQQKFLVYLSSKDPNSAKLCKLINDNITKSYLVLIKIIYKLQVVIGEKTQMLKLQLEEALKESQKVSNEILGYEEKIKSITKEKDVVIQQLKDQVDFLQTKNTQLDNENKVLTEKFMQNSKDLMGYGNSGEEGNFGNNVYNSGLKRQFKPKQPSLPQSSSHPQLSQNQQNPQLNQQNSNLFLNNEHPLVLSNTTFCNNLSTLQNPPICNRVFTINMMKEVMNSLYNSKAEFDKKSDENKLPHETLEQHMYTYLNQKYGLKSMIIEWASNIINGIKVFSCEDSEICLFGKILRNEIEEDARFIYGNLVQRVTECMKAYLRNKYPFKSTKDINSLIKQRKTTMIPEEEWTKIIASLFAQEEAQILINKVMEVIQKKYFKSRLDTDRKLTREEIIKLSQIREEMNIPFDDLIKILHEFHVKGKEKYLKNFVYAFKRVDKDNNGIIDEEEFINMLCNFNIFGDQIKEKIVEILTQIDPYNNKQITFSECVNLFSQLPYYDENGNLCGSILDRICIPEQVISMGNNINNINNINNNSNNINISNLGNLTMNNNGMNDGQINEMQNLNNVVMIQNLQNLQNVQNIEENNRENIGGMDNREIKHNVPDEEGGEN